MYSMSKDTYTCDTCGFEEKWDAHDDRRGDIWECEYCGAHFCTECFVKKLGREHFDMRKAFLIGVMTNDLSEVPQQRTSRRRSFLRDLRRSAEELRRLYQRE